MEQQVVISIKGVQTYENAQPDTMELVTRGIMAREAEGYRLEYEESEMTGLEGTSTIIQVQPEQVTLTREGEFTTQMVFQEGRRHLSMYNTPYGAMTVGVNTRHLLARVDENGGEVEIDYAIEIDHAVAGRNLFRIEVKPAQGVGSL